MQKEFNVYQNMSYEQKDQMLSILEQYINKHLDLSGNPQIAIKLNLLDPYAPEQAATTQTPRPSIWR